MSRGSLGADRGADRVVRSWLHEERHEDATRVLDTVLAEVDTTPQRRSGGMAWRFLTMNNNIVRVGLAAAAVVVIAIIALNLSPGSQMPGGEPTPSATPEPTATPEPSPPTPASAPPLTQSFTSARHGISVSYPEGWTAQAATEPWTDSTFPLEWGEPHADWLSDPTLTYNLFLTLASQPIGDATPEDWVAEQIVAESADGCSATEPIAVDGANGLIGAEGCDIVVVTTAGRGYWIQLYTSGDDPSAVAPYDRAWFEQVLSTVQLNPGDAVD